MGRPSNKEQRRDEIVSALLQVMSEKGFDGASIKDIADKAGLAPGLIHHHFKNKQQILLALVKSVIAIGEARYENEIDNVDTPYAKLSAFVHAQLGLGQGANLEAVKAWVLIGSEAVKQKEVRVLYRDAIDQRQTLLVDLLKKASNSGMRKSEAVSLAAIILSSIEGAYLLGVTCQEVMPNNYAAKSVMRIIDQALSK